MAHIRQSTTDSSLVLQVNVLATCQVVPSSLGSRFSVYRGTSLIRKRHPLGPYSRPTPRALRWSYGGAVSYELGTHVSAHEG